MTNRPFAVALDCTDAAVVGGFWAQTLGQALDPGAGKEAAKRDSMRWATLLDPDGDEFDVIAVAA